MARGAGNLGHAGRVRINELRRSPQRPRQHGCGEGAVSCSVASFVAPCVRSVCHVLFAREIVGELHSDPCCIGALAAIVAIVACSSGVDADLLCSHTGCTARPRIVMASHAATAASHAATAASQRAAYLPRCLALAQPHRIKLRKVWGRSLQPGAFAALRARPLDPVPCYSGPCCMRHQRPHKDCRRTACNVHKQRASPAAVPVAGPAGSPFCNALHNVVMIQRRAPPLHAPPQLHLAAPPTPTAAPATSAHHAKSPAASGWWLTRHPRHSKRWVAGIAHLMFPV